MGVQESDDGQHPSMVLFGLGDLELAQDAPHVLLHGALRDDELPGDSRVRPSLSHQRQHLTFSCRERSERVVTAPSADEFLDESRVDDGAASGDACDLVDELDDVSHPSLQEVADSSAACQQLYRLVDFDVMTDGDVVNVTLGGDAPTPEDSSPPSTTPPSTTPPTGR